MHNFLYILSILLSLTSCQTIMIHTYGMNKNKLYNNEEIERYEQKFNIPLEASYRLDTTYTALMETVKNASDQGYYYQLLQVFYFDEKDSLVSYHVSCNTGGVPNLKWEYLDTLKNKNFDQFPPTTQTELNTPIGYKELITTIKQTKNTEQIENQKYKVIVFWNIFMGRQSKRLIQTVQKNITLTNESVKVYYVNNDIFDW